jgi:hypothetical protein
MGTIEQDEHAHILACNRGLFRPVTSPPAFDRPHAEFCSRRPNDRNGNNVWVFPAVDGPPRQRVLFEHGHSDE